MSVFSFRIHATTYLASWTVFGCHMNCLMPALRLILAARTLRPPHTPNPAGDWANRQNVWRSLEQRCHVVCCRTTWGQLTGAEMLLTIA